MPEEGQTMVDETNTVRTWEPEDGHSFYATELLNALTEAREAARAKGEAFSYVVVGGKVVSSVRLVRVDGSETFEIVLETIDEK